MTKPVTSIYWPADIKFILKLSQSISQWDCLKKTPKHTTDEAEAKEMPPAPVTVY